MTAADLLGTLVLLFLVATLLGLARLLRQRRKPEEITITESPSGEQRVPSRRELRRAEMRARMRQGLCANCDDPAEFPRPRLEPVRSLLDPLLTWVGAIQPNRYRIDPMPLKTPHSLCPRHHEQVRGHMEQEVAEEVAAWSEFASKQRARMYEVEAHGIDERIEATMAEIRKYETSAIDERIEVTKAETHRVKGKSGAGRTRALPLKAPAKVLTLTNGSAGGGSNGNGGVA